MFGEKRKLVNSWTFDWFSRRTGMQCITMKLYECSGFLASCKYLLELVNNRGDIIETERYPTFPKRVLMDYYFKIHEASIIDKDMLAEDMTYDFDRINQQDFEVMRSLYWDEFDEAYPNHPELQYPNGNGWNFNPLTKEYFAFFRGWYDTEARQHDIVKAFHLVPKDQKGRSFVNLKISNQTAFIESENGETLYDFQNPDPILFLAEQSYLLHYGMSVFGYLLLKKYYGY